MELFLFRIVKYITLIVFTLCIIGTTFNLIKCISKYLNINKNLTLYKNNSISSEDLNLLTEKEYYLWIYNFLIEFNYLDSKDSVFLNNVVKDIKDSLIASKNNLPIFVKIIRLRDNSNISLNNCHEFLGEMICKKCSVGILIYNDTFPEKCKAFLNTIPEDFKITYLNNSEIIEFYNKISDFPTSLA